MTTHGVMPSRGASKAPRFSPDEPRELRRYFQDLENLFTNFGITEDAVKKHYACHYVNIETSDLWSSISAYGTAVSWDNFVQAIYKLYPGTDDEQRWTIADMDALVGSQLRIGIYDKTTLLNYYRPFITITEYLLKKNRISKAEQCRAFLRGFQQAFLVEIHRRLEIKFPDHIRDDPYELEGVYKAAEFVLTGSTTGAAIHHLSNSNSPQMSSSSKIPIKEEDFKSYMDSFAKSIIKAIGNQRQPSVAPPTNQQPSFARPLVPPDELHCHWCGGIGHFTRECPDCKDAITAGKCKRNDAGKIVLPNGQFVPRQIPGVWIKDRVEEWHRRNPGQIVAGMLAIPSNTQMPAHTSQMLYDISSSGPTSLSSSTSTSAFQLSTEERVKALEAEILVLRGKQVFDGVEMPPRRFKSANTAPSQQEESRKQAEIPSVQPTVTKETESTTHPFTKTKETIYAPPQNKNYATPPAKPSKEKEPAYHTQAPIYSPQIAQQIYNRSMKSPFVTLSPEELFSISPEIRNKFKEAISSKRIMPLDVNSYDVNEYQAEPFSPQSHLDPDEIFRHIIPPLPKEGSIVVPDPYEVYFRNVPQGQIPERMTVAKESHALRSIVMLLDGREKVECIVDPGSQIVAMSEDVCHDLGLTYDPAIRLNMQSANGDVDQSLGLARNIAAKIGEITLYLQIHVIKSPAYDILLGRPFDVLTESTVKNYANENQTITISDPNSKRIVTIPTIPRGPPRHQNNHHAPGCPSSGFPNSMI